MNPLIHVKKATPAILVIFACFGLAPGSRAVSPPPDGGYPSQNTVEGDAALFSLTTGASNTAAGFRALFHNTTGSDNTAIGFEALFSNSFSLASPTNGNTAIGSHAMFSNTFGLDNTATGFQALYSNTSGDGNTANGWFALYHSARGHRNTATGASTLFSNITGDDNTAIGYAALHENTIGSENTATGEEALSQNTSGMNNTAVGVEALFVSNGSFNTAIGCNALDSNTTGNGNTAVGRNALFGNSTGSNNLAVGNNAGGNVTTGNDNIHIGNPGLAGDSGRIRIGTFGSQTATFIAGIQGVTVENGVPVLVGSGGQLGSMTSSIRFKEAIKPMEKASEAILALKPVTFHYKNDKSDTPQFGLIAEEVEKVNPDLVVRDEEGRPYSVRYDQVNAMLLNEFLKEHCKVQEQGATIARLQKQVEALTAGLQKVSAQLELNKPARQTVLNNQ